MKRLRLWLSFILLVLAFSSLQYSCKKKDTYDTSPSASLTFSTKIVKFDTVFTTVGSATHNFTARNPNKQAVKLSHIMLQGGAASPFRINIDGRATTDFPNYELAAGDSLYIFAEVTINPNIANMPFIVTDTILFILNGHTQKVALQAFGRNAHFITDQYAPCNADWINDGIPYVIYQATGVQSKCTLTIEQGVTVYCHANAIFLVNGTLICKGTKSAPVTFRQDRLEHQYDNEPGQWYGIKFSDSSNNNILTHTIISEASVAIEVDSLVPGDSAAIKLTLNKCIIKNTNSTGLACFGSNVNATNTLIYNSGMYNVYCNLGGKYNFTYCTFDNSFSNALNPVASIEVGNQLYKNIDSTATPLNLHANFRNCVINGVLDDEVALLKYRNVNLFDTIFYHDIIKAKKARYNTAYNYLNKNPGFVNAMGGDYHLDSVSFAIRRGENYGPIPVPDDLDDVSRIRSPSDTIPDIGCYQFAH